MKSLPNKLSELLMVAVGDLMKAEKSPDYEVDMNLWHVPGNEKCSICFAGSVMAFTLEIASTRYATPSDTGNQMALLALDEARVYRWHLALRYLRHPNKQPIPTEALEALDGIDPVYYESNSLQFKINMLVAAAILDSFNL